MKFRRNDLLLISFIDHSSGVDEAMEFIAIGRLVDINERRILIDSWAYADPDTPRDINVDRMSVVLGAVSRITLLRQGPSIKLRHNINERVLYALQNKADK